MKHAEVLTLIRVEQQLGGAGSLANKVPRIVSDRKICKDCFNPNIEAEHGLLRAMRVMGIKRLILESPNGFGSTTGTVVEIVLP